MQGKPDPFWFIILYLLPIIGAIAMAILFTNLERRDRYHMYQSSVEGVVLIILFIILRVISAMVMDQAFSTSTSFSTISSAVSLVQAIVLIIDLISFLIWIYGIFVGFKASQGSDVKMVFVGNITDKIMAA
ncbi:hypothetical protein ACNF42_03220 [Cuniculiplasma sp. SKW3]|uniref:hypothetical protein n=1 Tax=unclassified Cuniculiplasma TaxID=2619706 RepID=UPI003FD0D452